MEEMEVQDLVLVVRTDLELYQEDQETLLAHLQLKVMMVETLHLQLLLEGKLGLAAEALQTLVLIE
tara:strand:+ start:151 stop:348 length:198 start_codon:yes stop_codon:yes gene_type:complete